MRRFLPLIWALTGCFEPSPAICTVSCAVDGKCPSGLTCVAGMCTTEGTACRISAIFDSGTLDGASRDSGTPDAREGMDAAPTPDGSLPDAAPVDAAGIPDGGSGSKDGGISTCAVGWDAYGTSCYRRTTSAPGSYQDARNDCVAMKPSAVFDTPDLAIITSSGEDTFIRNTYLPGAVDDLWIGLSYHFGNWQWVDNTDLGVSDYEGFAGSIPPGSSGDCVQLANGTGVWQVRSCTYGPNDQGVCEYANPFQ